MNRQIIYLLSILTLFFYSLSCKTRHVVSKGTYNSCDTLKNFIEHNALAYTPIINNIDTNYQVFTTKNGGDDCYQIKFKYIKKCDAYKIWIDEIQFDFNVNTDNCIVIGDEVNCYVNELTLGNECLKRYNNGSQNCFDCIYHKPNNWTIKVAGYFCNKFVGPSSVLTNVSLQCNEN